MRDTIKKKDTCLLAGAADFYSDRAGELREKYVIALDGGYASLRERGLIPDAVIGDFDSLGYVPDAEHLTVLPRVKDDTDSFWAAKHALGLGYRRFYLCGCAEGARADHTAANIALMLYLSHHGAESVMMEGERMMYTVASAPFNMEFSGESGTFSVFALSEKVSGLTLRGFEYETDRITLHSDIPLGVSNSFASDKCTVEAESGDVLIIWEK